MNSTAILFWTGVGVPGLVRNLFLEWKVKGLGKKRKVVWRLTPICLFWCIWGERNRRTFQDEELSNQSLGNLFLYTACVRWVCPLFWRLLNSICLCL